MSKNRRRQITENRRRITENRIRSILEETILQESHGGLPCPIEIAKQLKAGGAQADDVVGWIAELMDAYRRDESSSPNLQAAISDPLAVVAVERYNRRNYSDFDLSTNYSASTLFGASILGPGFKK
jgi:hypothetical protein